MRDEYRRREPWETRESLDRLIDKGMEGYRRKAELSGGWKKAGIISGIAAACIGAGLGFGYLARAGFERAQTIVEENNGSVYSSVVMINKDKEKEIEEKIVYVTPEIEETLSPSDMTWGQALKTMADGFSDSAKEMLTAPFQDFGYETEPLLPEYGQPTPAIEQTQDVPVPTPTPEFGQFLSIEELSEPEDMFTVGLSRATLYNGNYGALVDEINRVSKSSGTIYYAQLHDENNTLVVEYEGVGYPETFQVGEDAIDSLISKTQGLRQESIHISGVELERLLEKNNSSLGELAGYISEYCSGEADAGDVEEWLRGAQLVNFVPRNGEHPLINIIWPEWVYTLYAKGNENMQTLMDLAYIPK